MSTTITLNCRNCSIDFNKNLREYNRQKRNGRTDDSFFCSRSCSCEWGNKNASEETIAKKTATILSVQPKATAAARKVNRKGRFTYYLKKARERTYLKENTWDTSDLTEEYLETIWNNQKGRCAWTSTPLQLTDHSRCNSGLYNASLDRIDSSKGYVQNNVQFVLTPLNLAKSNYPEVEFIEFLKTIGVKTE